MQVRAAVLRGAAKPYEIEDVQIEDALRDDEVLVRTVASGICHSDLTFQDAAVPEQLPVILGHEGAGIVHAVGKAVVGLKPGDHVVATFSYCGKCANCQEDLMAYCADFAPLNFGGCRADGTVAYRQQDAVVHGHFFGQSSFASYILATERNLVKVPDDLDLTLLGPLGCGLQTGAGTVINKLKPKPGSSIAIFGCGTVGLAALMAAKHLGCAPIIAVDPNQERLDLALSLGATHVLNPNTENVVARIQEVTGGGANFSVECVGLGAVVRQALECLGAPSVCASVGFQGPENLVEINQGHLLFGRSLVGVIEGDANPQDFVLEMIDLYRRGRFPFDRLIRRFPFERINDACEAMRRGQAIKPVLLYES